MITEIITEIVAAIITEISAIATITTVAVTEYS